MKNKLINYKINKFWGNKIIEEISNNHPWYTKIKFIRISKGWSQKKAGDMCSTYKKSYWQWENGHCYPSGRNRKIIAIAFTATVLVPLK